MKRPITEELWIYLPLAAAAHAVAYLTVGGTSRQYFFVFGAAFGVLIVGFWSLLNWLRSKATGNGAAEALRRIHGLPLAEAKDRAEALLADPRKFRFVAASPADRNALSILADDLRDFFGRYDRVATAPGEAAVDRSLIGESTLRPGFIKIGEDFEETEIVVKPGDSRVFEIDGTEPQDVEPESHPSIYHWILAVAPET